MGRKPWAGTKPTRFEKEVQDLWPSDIMATPLAFGLPYPFGDGSDGNVAVTGTTSLTGYDIKQYLNLRVESGGTLNTSTTGPTVLIIYVRERLYVAGTIDMNSKGAAYADGASTSSFGGAGGGGGADNGGGDGTAGRSSIVSGGAGGTGLGGAGSAGSTLTPYYKANFRMRVDAKENGINSYGMGGGAGQNEGAAGGRGGGGILIFAAEISLASTGVIRANGANGTAASVGGSGGGGGGGGGFIYIVTRKFTDSGGSITVTAGSGGAGTGGGGTGGAGGAGTYILERVPT